MSIGNKLAEARKRQNLTQEQLAERLGVTRLLKQAVGRKVRVSLFDGEGIPGDWCVILDFDGSWANLEVVKKKEREILLRLDSVENIEVK